MKSGNPYEKMNEVQTPFQEEPLTIHEKENLHQLAKSYAKGQTKSPRKWPLAVVAAVLIGGFALSFSYGNGSVLAGMVNLASDVRVSLRGSNRR